MDGLLLLFSRRRVKLGYKPLTPDTSAIRIIHVEQIGAPGEILIFVTLDRIEFIAVTI